MPPSFVPPAPIAWLLLIPFAPVLAAVMMLLLRRGQGKMAGVLLLVALAGAGTAALRALGLTWGNAADPQVLNFVWVELGTTSLHLGALLDFTGAVAAVLVVTIAFGAALYARWESAGDPDQIRFFRALALTAAGLLGMTIANSLLLLVMCWQLAGFGCWLLAASAARSPDGEASFFTLARIGDLALVGATLVVLVQGGTMLFHDSGRGFLEGDILRQITSLHALGADSDWRPAAHLIVIAAVLKTMQLPLERWTPPAPRGSIARLAMIFLATLGAPLFLLARLDPLLLATSPTLPTWALGLCLVGVVWTALRFPPRACEIIDRILPLHRLAHLLKTTASVLAWSAELFQAACFFAGELLVFFVRASGEKLTVAGDHRCLGEALPAAIAGTVETGGGWLRRAQNGSLPRYTRWMIWGLLALPLLLWWARL